MKYKVGDKFRLRNVDLLDTIGDNFEVATIIEVDEPLYVVEGKHGDMTMLDDKEIDENFAQDKQ